jgi:hypothetical protein
VAINGGQVLVRPDSEGLVIETDSFIHMELRSARGDPVTGETRDLPNGRV